MESLKREKKLYDATIRGDIQSLNELLSEDKFEINHNGSLSGFCFNETPLHIASTRGYVDFAKVLLQHKPELVYGLDSRLRAPLHLASANGQVEMVKLLLKEDSDVCLMEDEFGRTPLHLAAMVKGRVEVVNELVQAKPEALMYPSNRMKTLTILHTYVIRNGRNALDQLVEADHTFLNSQDGEGNTILHKVVALKKLETLEYLVSKTQLAVKLKNRKGFKALDIIKQMPKDPETTKMRKLLVKRAINTKTTQSAQGEVDHIKQTWLEKKREGILVAATLIAGMAYQAGLNPPGGVWDENKFDAGKNYNTTVLAGTSILAANDSTLYILFGAFNTTSFIAALSTVLLLIRGSPRLGTTRCCVLLQKVYMWFLTGVMWVTTTTMAATYITAMYAITPNYEGFNFDDTLLIINSTANVWMGLVCIVFLINACRFFICISVKLVKCIKKLINACRFFICRNGNEVDQRQRPSDAATTTCFMSV